MIKWYSCLPTRYGDEEFPPDSGLYLTITTFWRIEWVEWDAKKEEWNSSGTIEWWCELPPPEPIYG